MIISTLIADDEPHARRYLKNLLDSDDEIGVVFECKNGKEVLDFLKHKQVDLIFLDINMPGINGIEVAEKIKNTDSLVIFSTAYDQYALKAFELKAFDYLLKPYDKKRFTEVLTSAKEHIELHKQADFSKKFAKLYRDYSDTISPHLTELKIKEKGFEKKVRLDEVEYIEASSVYAILHTINNDVLYRVSLNLLEQQLPHNFFRVHRSFIINENFIESYSYQNDSTYKIKLQSGVELKSSRKYQKEIIDRNSKE